MKTARLQQAFISILAGILFSCSGSSASPELERAAVLVEHFTTPSVLSNSTFPVVLPDGTPKQFVSWLFSGMGVRSTAVRTLGRDGAASAQAILTTDAFAKTAAVQVDIDGTAVTIGGMAKGAGMIHPQMATTLCFLTTDAAVSPGLLRTALRAAVDRSFNCISVDGDTSTNDTVLLLANGAAGQPVLADDGADFARFTTALTDVAASLAQIVVRDGEGASKLVTVRVQGARSRSDAKAAAAAVMTSPLVKTAVYGAEPNWGRVLAAVGRSGAAVREDRIAVWIGGHQVVAGGTAAGDPGPAAATMRAAEYELVIDLGLGDGTFTGWMSDLNEAYVKINAGYMI